MAVRSTRTEAKVCTPLCEHEVGRRLRMTCCGCLMPCHVQHRLCWVGGVDAGSCWGAACCASRDIAARAVRACGRHPRAHAQLRSICGRWWQRRTATATRSPALGTKLEAWRTFCDACDARLPAGLQYGSGGAGQYLRRNMRVGLASCTLTAMYVTCMSCAAPRWPPWPTLKGMQRQRLRSGRRPS